MKFRNGSGRAGRGVAAIASGTVVGQLILVAATPILSRLYPPASYGSFSILLAVASVLGPFATLRLEAAIVIPKDDDSARRILRLGTLSALVISGLSGLLTWVFQDAGWIDGLGEVEFAPLWVAGVVLATATFSVLTQAALRERSYGAVAKRSVTQSTGIVVGQLALSIVTRGPAGLLGGYLFGRSVGYVPLVIASRRLLTRPSSGTYRGTLRRFWKFPAIFAPAALLNTLGGQLPLIIIAAAFGAVSAGELGIAQRLVFIPSTLIGAAVADVIGAEIASRLREGVTGVRQLYLKTSLWTFGVAMFVVATILLIAPWLLPAVLGESWDMTGLFAQAMSVSIGVGLVSSPLSRVFLIFERSRSILAIDASRVIGLLLCVGGIQAWTLDAVQATLLLSLVQAVVGIISWAVGLQVVWHGEPAKPQREPSGIQSMID